MGYGLWGDGIYIKSCENCTIKVNNAIGIGTYGRGIHLTSSHHNTIEGNTIDGKIVMNKGRGTSGISLESSDYNNISFNRPVDNGGSGIYLHSSWHNSILGNTAYNNYPGAFLRFAGYSNITGNIFDDQGDEASMVVLLSIKCSAVNNYANIDLADSDDCTVAGNTGWIKHSTIPTN
jgi:parallel beta-helix repeat protein